MGTLSSPSSGALNASPSQSYQVNFLPEGYEVQGFTSAIKGVTPENEQAVLDRYASQIKLSDFNSYLAKSRDRNGQYQSVTIRGHTFEKGYDFEKINFNGKSLHIDTGTQLKIYDSQVFVVGKRYIQIGADSRGSIDIPMGNNKKDTRGVDINEKREVAYITMMDNGFSVNKGQLSKKEGVEKPNELMKLTKILNFSEYGGENSNDVVRITENGNVIVFGTLSHDADEEYSMYINGEPVLGIHPSIVSIIAFDLQGEVVYLRYRDDSNKERSLKINLESTKHRPGEADRRVQIARKATVRVLERNAGLIKGNAELAERAGVLESELQGQSQKHIGEHSILVERQQGLERENNKLKRSLEENAETLQIQDAQLLKNNETFNQQRREIEKIIVGLQKLINDIPEPKIIGGDISKGYRAHLVGALNELTVQIKIIQNN